ncbi:glycosyltransferase [Litchfieldia alkalitelluris]|uniref:glycosyltransferase n=1 Tax=Litchfieldia alkalitelluris TaxID=304268 RepID=UPI0014730D18|nr:glycosyltransferase [Litchfieldia alkalitelluris]
MKVSIAIPIYNAARHLNVTLDSLMHQTMSKDEFEIICVNDRSTDNSKEVISEYSKVMKNLILIDRAENSGGPMIPRNDAIEAARGEYIMFLDNDDFIGEETLERFYNQAVKNKSDVIYGKYVGVNGRVVPQSMFQSGNLYNSDIIKDNLVYSLAPHKMFNLAFIKENNFRFHPKAVVGEDQLFVMQCYIKAKVITVLADYDYYYVVARGNENLSLKYFPAEEFFFSFNRIMEFLQDSDIHELYKKELKIAFINRFLHASRLRGHLLSNLLTNDQKKDWLNEAKLFFDKHVDDEIVKQLASRFHYFVNVVKDNDIKKLLFIHKQLDKVTAIDVTRVEDGLIYARVKQHTKECAYDEEHVVNQNNTSNIFINKVQFEDSFFVIEGQMTQSLLINKDIAYELKIVHRETGIEKSVVSIVDPYSSGVFEFMVYYKELLFDHNLLGAWDLFVEASINGYVKRRRIGKDRDLSIKAHKPVSGISSFGKKYVIKPYYTKPHDNLSFNVVLNEKDKG